MGNEREKDRGKRHPDFHRKGRIVPHFFSDISLWKTLRTTLRNPHRILLTINKIP